MGAHRRRRQRQRGPQQQSRQDDGRASDEQQAQGAPAPGQAQDQVSATPTLDRAQDEAGPQEDEGTDQEQQAQGPGAQGGGPQDWAAPPDGEGGGAGGPPASGDGGGGGADAGDEQGDRQRAPASDPSGSAQANPDEAAQAQSQEQGPGQAVSEEQEAKEGEAKEAKEGGDGEGGGEGGGGEGDGGAGGGGGGGGGGGALAPTPTSAYSPAMVPEPGVPEPFALEPDLDDEQAKQITQATGMSPQQHAALLQGTIESLKGLAEQHQQTIVSEAETLASTLASEAETLHLQVIGRIDLARSTVATAYTDARGAVDTAVETATTTIETRASTARTRLETSRETQSTELQSRFDTAAETIDSFANEMRGPFETLENDTADDFQRAANDAADRVANNKSTIAQGFDRSGDVIEQHKGELLVKAAEELVDQGVQSMRDEAPNKAQAVLENQQYHEVLSGFSAPLRQRAESVRDQGQSAIETAFTTSSERIETEREGALATVDSTAAEARQNLTTDEQEATDELDLIETQAELDAETRVTDAEGLLTETSASLVQDYADWMQALNEGLPDTSFIPADEGERFLEGMQTELEGIHAQHLQRLAELRSRISDDWNLEAQELLTRVEAIESGNTEETARIRGELQATLEQTGTRFGDSMTEAGAAVDTAMQQYTAPMIQELEAWRETCRAELEAQLETTRTNIEGELQTYEGELQTEVDQFAENIDPSSAIANVESELRDICRDSYSAMRGMGTDENKLFNALRKASTALKGRAVRHMWTLQYPTSGSLQSWLVDDLGDDELDIAETYLAGNTAEAARMELDYSMQWYGDDEAQIEQIMRDLSPEQRQAMLDSDEWAETEARLQDNLGGTDLDVTNALIAGNVARADAYRLRDTIDDARRSRDTDDLHTALAGMDPARREQIIQEMYHISHGVEAGDTDVEPVDEDVARNHMVEFATRDFAIERNEDTRRFERTELQGPNRDLAVALIDEGNDSLEADVARFEVERNRLGGPNEQNLETALYMSAEEQHILRSPDHPEYDRVRNEQQARAQQFEQRWQERYGGQEGEPGSVNDAMEQMYEHADNGELEAETHQMMLEDGTNSPRVVANLTQLSVDGAGTDDERLQRAWQGMTPDETAEAEQIWEDEHGNGESLDDRLYGGTFSELSGDDRRNIERMRLGDERYMNAEQRLALAQHEYDWSMGDESGVMGNLIMEGSHESNNLQQHWADLNALLDEVADANEGNAFADDGAFQGTEDQYQQYRRLCAFVGINAAHFRERQESILNALTTAAAVLVAAVATFLSGGTLGPAAAMWVAAVSGATKIALSAAVLGGRYGWERMAQDVAITAVEVATAGIGARLNAGGGLFSAAEKVNDIRNVSMRMAGQGIVGFGTGFTNAAASGLIQERDDWAYSGLRSGVTGGVSASVGEAFNVLKVDRAQGFWQHARNVGAGTAGGTMGDMVGEGAGLGMDAGTGRFTGEFDDAMGQVFQKGLESFLTNALKETAGAWGEATGTGRNAQNQEQDTGEGAGEQEGPLRPGAEGEIDETALVEAGGMDGDDLSGAMDDAVENAPDPTPQEMNELRDAMAGGDEDQPTVFEGPDGTRGADFEDGGVVAETPDGQLVVESPDGGVAVVDGEVQAGEMPDGTQVFSDGQDAMIVHPDGTVEATFAEGGGRRTDGEGGGRGPEGEGPEGGPRSGGPEGEGPEGGGRRPEVETEGAGPRADGESESRRQEQVAEAVSDVESAEDSTPSRSSDREGWSDDQIDDYVADRVEQLVDEGHISEEQGLRVFDGPDALNRLNRLAAAERVRMARESNRQRDAETTERQVMESVVHDLPERMRSSDESVRQSARAEFEGLPPDMQQRIRSQEQMDRIRADMQSDDDATRQRARDEWAELPEEMRASWSDPSGRVHDVGIIGSGFAAVSDAQTRQDASPDNAVMIGQDPTMDQAVGELGQGVGESEVAGAREGTGMSMDEIAPGNPRPGDGYMLARDHADATAVHRDDAGIGRVDGQAGPVERASSDWPAWAIEAGATARVPVRTTTPDGAEVTIYQYFRSLDVAGGPGAARQLPEGQMDPATAQRLRESGQLHDADWDFGGQGVEEGQTVTVIGGGAAGAWATQQAAEQGAHVQWRGRRPNADQMRAQIEAVEALRARVRQGDPDASREWMNLPQAARELPTQRRILDIMTRAESDDPDVRARAQQEMDDYVFTESPGHGYFPRNRAEGAAFDPSMQVDEGGPVQRSAYEEISAIEQGDDGRVRIVYTDGRVESTDHLVLAIGQDPNNPGGPGAMLGEYDGDLHPVFGEPQQDGFRPILGLESSDGALRVMGAAAASGSLARMISPDARDPSGRPIAPRDYMDNLQHQGSQLPADSSGVIGGFVRTQQTVEQMNQER